MCCYVIVDCGTLSFFHMLDLSMFLYWLSFKDTTIAELGIVMDRLR